MLIEAIDVPDGVLVTLPFEGFVTKKIVWPLHGVLMETKFYIIYSSCLKRCRILKIFYLADRGTIEI